MAVQFSACGGPETRLSTRQAAAVTLNQTAQVRKSALSYYGARHCIPFLIDGLGTGPGANRHPALNGTSQRGQNIRLGGVRPGRSRLQPAPV